MTTLQEFVEKHNNDYSHLEPFLENHPLKTSIIIPVYNRADLLDATLATLVRQDDILRHPDLFELIIVNDGSPEDIEAVVKKYQFPIPVHYLENGKNEGRSYTRNKGMAHAKGELFVFFDSDVLIPSGYFHEHWKIHARSKDVVAVGFVENVAKDDERIGAMKEGADLKPDIYRDFRHYTNTLYRTTAAPREYRLMDETSGFKHFNHPIDNFTLPDMVVTHNMSVRAEHARHVDGFDERFQGWGYEDTHFGAKLIGAGCFVIPLPTGVFRIKHPLREHDETVREQDRQRNKKLYHQLLEEEWGENNEQ